MQVNKEFLLNLFFSDNKFSNQFPIQLLIKDLFFPTLVN